MVLFTPAKIQISSQEHSPLVETSPILVIGFQKFCCRRESCDIFAWVCHIEFYERIKNTVYRLQISALVPEIFKFEKWVKYANKMTDDAIHSTQYYIEYIKRAILANLQCRTLKLGRLIVLQETHPWQLTLFQSPPTWFQYASDFQLENVKQGHKLGQRWPEKLLIWGRSETQFVAMVTELLSSY